MSNVTLTAKKIISNIEDVVIGKRQEIVLALVAYFCEGHILLEDVPGVAKTILARALAASVGCEFNRIQCTPDLLPTDITGASVFNPKTTEFDFRPGPLFTQILLADEINRTTPRTQAALLEAMAERRCDGGWPDLRSGAAVYGHRHAKPGGPRRHVPAAGGSARPVLDPPEPGLPHAQGRRRNARTPADRPSDRPPCGRWSPRRKSSPAKRRFARSTSIRKSGITSWTSCTRPASMKTFS